MLIQIALLLTGSLGGQTIATTLDSDFGKLDYNYRTAGVLWAYYLVDPWQQDGLEVKYTGKGLAKVARPSLEDLLSRLNRPITENIALGHLDQHPSNAKDDLAAGIAFWTLQWKADAMHNDGWQTFHDRAETFLVKATHEGDIIQQSFASLAYAYCPYREYGDHVGFVQEHPVPALPGRQARLDEHRARLIDTYKRFRTSVPERALRAAYQLASLAHDERRDEEAEHWRKAIVLEFGALRAWYCYRGSKG